MWLIKPAAKTLFMKYRINIETPGETQHWEVEIHAPTALTIEMGADIAVVAGRF